MAFFAIALSVVMHIAWNLMARHTEAKQDFLWWGILCHLLLVAPFGFYGLIVDALWSKQLLLLMLMTSVANALYFLSLRQAYRYAAVALVYPLARSSPILIAFWAWLFFDEQLPTLVWLGIGVSVIGLWLLASTAKGSSGKPALYWAITAACFTSVYSLSDKAATAYLPNFMATLGFISVGYFCSFLVLSLHNLYINGAVIPPARPQLAYLIFGGLSIGTGYALVVYAMASLPAAFVVALTNAGIVLAVIIAMVFMHERDAWASRLLAVAIIIAGLLLVGFFR